MLSSAKVETRLLVGITRARVARLQPGARNGVTGSAFVNSLPKSGTNLLLKLMKSLRGMQLVELRLGQRKTGAYRPRAGEPSIPAGIALPAEMSLRRLARTVGRLPAGSYFWGHMPYSRAFSELLAASHVKMVLIVRDPRDVVVSSAAYLASRPGHRLSASFRPLTEEERVLASISGLPDQDGRPGLRSIGERVASIVPWMSEPFVYVTRFEHLVGPAGGGSEYAQIEEVRNITAHVGRPLPDEEVRHLAAGLFGGTPTFRNGKIGAWREVFTERHVAAAKPLLDDLLVELGYETTSAWPS
ncbi:MAG: sulfotransferase domain-containing protein [Egibacteraceae bacterium]